MPQQGARDLSRTLPLAVPITLAAVEAAPTLHGTMDVLQVMFEVHERGVLELLPPALRPTIPPLATFSVWRCSEGPAAPFALAQVRLLSRAGFRSRGLLLGSYGAGSAETLALLRRHWGFDCRPGTITLRRYHERVLGEVSADGEPILQMALVNPEAVANDNLEHAANLNVVQIDADGAPAIRLLQAEPEYRVERADRGQPLLETFTVERWSAAGLRPNHRVSALAYRGEFRLPPVRYVMDPNLPPEHGTQRLATGQPVPEQRDARADLPR